MVNNFFAFLFRFDHLLAPGPTELSSSVGSGSNNMGVELANERAGFHEMEDVNYTDNEVVCHIRTALKSVSSVSLANQ